MKEKINVVITILVVIGIVVGSFSLWKTYSIENKIEKSAYVDLKLIFDGFDMKKELELKLKKDLLQKQNELDSLLFQLQGLNNKLNNTEKKNQEEVTRFQQMQNHYMQQKNAVEEYTYTKTQQFDSQILEQMTQYVKDFGTKNNYHYIYGLNSNGNIMYAQEHKDITEEVLKFINDKYQGRN